MGALQALRGRAARRRRPGPAAGQLILTMRRVYILPGRPGLGYALLLSIMLAASLNYNLGLGYALTFLAASCAAVDMLLTVKNLAWLRLAAGRAAPVHAGEEARFELHLHNPGKLARYAVWVGFQDAGAPRHALDVAAGGSAGLTLSTPGARRGWLAAPRVLLQTRFPLGLFRAWAYWQPEARVLVYPYPETPSQPLPGGGAASQDGHGAVGLDNYAGIRPYQPGDPPRHLAWRQIARLDPALGGTLATKHFDGGAVAELSLDYAALPAALDQERKLSRLTRWVLEAELQALPYTLRLGPQVIGPGLGEAQRAACLQALALYGAEAAAPAPP